MPDSIQTLIAGRWRDASRPRYSTEYPADGSTVAALHAASAADVDEAVQNAEVARQRGNWAGVKRHGRGALLHRIAVGTVWVNAYKVFSVSTPFGGVKTGGTGREKGRLGILEYTSQKSFYWGLNESPMPWSTAP